MDNRQVVRSKIAESGVTGILRGVSEEHIVDVAKAIHRAGVTAIEITADTRNCSEVISTVERELEGTDAVIGAGTVMDAATARNVIEAGAEFVLSPNVPPEVIRACNRYGVVSIPGVMTPTEAEHALTAGADILKMFPATTVGPEHIGALQGPLGDIPIMPTGGITPENVAAYFDHGALAVGAGSGLVNHDAIEDGDIDRVQQQAAEFVDAVERARDNNNALV